MGNQIAQTDANGNVTRWVYDNAGRPLQHILPLGMRETFVYDVGGNILQHTDFNGRTTQFIYDSDQHLVRKTYPDGSKVEYSYTDMGQIATMRDSRGLTRYEYDLHDRLKQVTQPDNTTIAYGYDLVGNRTAMTTTVGVTRYEYDALNRQRVITDTLGGVTTHEYDAVGNRVRTIHANGTLSEMQYDALGRLIELQHRRADASLITSYRYTLDAAGNRTQVVENGVRTLTYLYDNLGRLIEEQRNDPNTGNQTTSFTYDAAHNLLNRNMNGQIQNYQYDANNRLLTDDNRSYGYDSNGNVITQTQGTTVTIYSYDAEDRLLTVTAPSLQVVNSYDDNGVRLTQQTNGVITRYLVDSNRPLPVILEERDAMNGLLAHYTWGDQLLSQQRAGARYVYHLDGLGSVRALSDASQAVVAAYDYNAYGELVNSSSSLANPFHFTGEPFDEATGLYYLRARFYNPELGRFITRDTFAGSDFTPLTLHRYLYANANPINFTDPTGHFSLAMTAPSISLPTITINMTYLLLAVRKARLVAAAATATGCAMAAVFSTNGASTPCDANIPILYPGPVGSQTFEHISDAIAEGYPALLTRLFPPRSRSWLNRTPPCNVDRGAQGKVCDEYPFASTWQGIVGASLRLVPAAEGPAQGGQLGGFYSACKVVPNDPILGWFVVVPKRGFSGYQCDDRVKPRSR